MRLLSCSLLGSAIGCLAAYGVIKDDMAVIRLAIIIIILQLFSLGSIIHHYEKKYKG